MAEFASGKYSLERPLPTHREWATRFKVSRITISRALDILKAERIVESKEGSYTFLSRIPSDAIDDALLASNHDKVTVSLWQLDRRDLRKLRLALARQQFQDQFRTRYPKIQFDERMVTAASGEFEARFLQSILCRDEPACGTTTQTFLPFLLDHESVTPFAVAGTDDYLERIRPEFIKRCSRDGKLYMLPSYISQSFLLYNKSLFEKAGIDIVRPLPSWDEFYEACVRLSASSQGKPSFHIVGTDGLVWWLMALAYQSLDRSPPESLPSVNWSSSAARQGIAQFLRLLSQRLLRVHCEKNSTIASRLLADEIPILLDDGSAASQVALLGESKRFGIAPLPVGPSGESLCLMNCGGWIVNSHTLPEQQLAAVTYALEWERWIHLGDGGGRLKRFGVHPSLASVLSDSQQDRFVSECLPDDWKKVLRSLQGISRWEPADADWKKKVLGHALEPLLKESEPITTEQVLQQLRLHEIECGFNESAESVIGART